MAKISKKHMHSPDECEYCRGFYTGYATYVNFWNTYNGITPDPIHNEIKDCCAMSFTICDYHRGFIDGGSSYESTIEVQA